MTDQSIEFLKAEIARLQEQLASSEKVNELLKDADEKLTNWLGESHAYLDTLLGWMEKAQGNIPPEYWQVVRETRLNLTRQQGLFLREFGK